MKTFGIALFTCLSLAVASGCGDDDDKNNDNGGENTGNNNDGGGNNNGGNGGNNGGGGSKEGCYLADENVCETYSDAIALTFCESLLGGTKRECPTENVEGVCVVEEDGETTTRHYYKGSDGSAWEDDFGDSAAEDCEFQEGTYSAR